MYGMPESDKLVTFAEAGLSNWGWYQNVTSFDPNNNKFVFTMMAGQHTNVGSVEIVVADCEESVLSPSPTWNIHSNDYCVAKSDEHIHIDTALPDKLGVPGHYKSNCCVAGESCYIVVHGVVDFLDERCPECN